MPSAPESRRQPLQGYNHNIQYNGRLFHVQTEDSGLKHPHLFTHLYHAGVIIASARTDYSELAAEAGHERKVRKLMQEQHKRLMKDLRRGVYDDKIKQLIGDDPQRPKPKTVSGTFNTITVSAKTTEEIDAMPMPELDAVELAEIERIDRLPRDTQPVEVPPDSVLEAQAAETREQHIDKSASAPNVGRTSDMDSSAPDQRSRPERPIARWGDTGLHPRLDAADTHTIRMVIGSEPGDTAATTVPQDNVPQDNTTGQAARESGGVGTAGSESAGPGRPHRQTGIFDQPLPRQGVPIKKRPVAGGQTAQAPFSATPQQNTGKSQRRASAPATTHQPSTPQRYVAPSATRTADRNAPHEGAAHGTAQPFQATPPAAETMQGQPAPDDNGIYQITVGGARPVQKSASGPRVVARPAVIVDRMPGRVAPSSLQQALSGVSPTNQTDETPEKGHASSPTSPTESANSTPAIQQQDGLPGIFGSDLISERSLDEVILQYLSEDHEQ